VCDETHSSTFEENGDASRPGKLFQGEKLCLDPANVYVDCDSTEVDMTSNWSGYLLVKSEKDVVAGGIYTLKSQDGRAGQLRIESASPDDSDKARAMFVGEGSLG
jgi:hypothetical protein